MAKRQGSANESNISASMQDLLRKMQSEEGGSVATMAEPEAAPTYDADRAESTRRRLMEDYRRELEALGKQEKKAARPSMYEYE
ncbi:MAG: hypothetical protein J6B77_05875, partial [Clostridia bacterium]|nr:hypothetical protein [Clostridia bacterium]